MFRLTTLYLAAIVLLGVWANVANGEETPAAPALPISTVAVDHPLAGSPELTIMVTDDAVTAPAEVPTGSTIVTQINRSSGDAHLMILRVPDEISDAAFDAAMRSSVTPDWFFAAPLVGNGDWAAPGGGLAVALVQITAGRHAVIDPFHPRQRTTFVATGEGTPPALPAVAADVVATLGEGSLRMPGSLAAGPAVWEITNTGTSPRELVVIPVPSGATAAQLLLAMGSARAESPFPSGLGEAWDAWSPVPVAGVGGTSPEGHLYTVIDLESGTYAAVCLVPTDDVDPHLTLGLTQIFTVTNAAP